MTSFTNSPSDWERLDWQILRDGGIALYWRDEYLAEDTKWLADHDYEIYLFDCGAWSTDDEMFSDFGRTMSFPDWFGRNFDALDDCISDLPLTESRGAAAVLTRFDAFASGIGSSAMRSNQNVAEAVLDILASSSRFHLLNGGRLVTLVQTNDPNLRIGKLGGATPQWNRREWLNAKRQPDSR